MVVDRPGEVEKTRRLSARRGGVRRTKKKAVCGGKRTRQHFGQGKGREFGEKGMRKFWDEG